MLVTAVFEAFRRVFERKTAALRSIAPPGPMPPALLDLLADEARALAGSSRTSSFAPSTTARLWTSPSVSLRALVTADADVVPDDPWGYREALVLAFRRYGITVPNVPDLSEGALLWQAPEPRVPAVAAIAYHNLKHAPRPELDPGEAERRRRAEAIGELVTHPLHARQFGLSADGGSADVEPPVVESVRTLRRISPDGELHFNIVAEITQRRRVHLTPRRWYWFLGGATLVLDADGQVRYAIAKSVDSRTRLDTYRRYLETLDAETRELLRADQPDRAGLSRRLHARRRRRP